MTLRAMHITPLQSADVDACPSLAASESLYMVQT